jgi:hypothetical protein
MWQNMERGYETGGKQVQMAMLHKALCSYRNEGTYSLKLVAAIIHLPTDRKTASSGAGDRTWQEKVSRSLWT